MLISENGDPKISDFGMSKKGQHNGDGDQRIVSAQGPIRWMAPESLRDHTYSTKTDVFSFGILVWEIITNGLVPHADMENLGELAIRRRDEGLVPEIPANAPAILVEICRKCWAMDPKERPSMRTILKMLQQYVRKTQRKGSRRRTVTGARPGASSQNLLEETPGQPSSSSTSLLAPEDPAPTTRKRSGSKDSSSSHKRLTPDEGRPRSDSVSSKKSSTSSKGKSSSAPRTPRIKITSDTGTPRDLKVSNPRERDSITPRDQKRTPRSRAGSVTSVVSAKSSKSTGSKKAEDSNRISVEEV